MISSGFNASTYSALQALKQMQNQMGTYQNQISTGLAVSSASDNPVLYAQAQALKSQESSLTSVQSSLTSAAGVTSVTSGALESVISVLDAMKTSVISAQDGSSSATSAQAAILSDQQQIISAIGSANYGGENLLNGTTTSPSFVTSFYENSSGALSFNSTTLSTDDTILSDSTSAGGLLGTAMSVTSATGTAGTSGGAGGAYAAASLLGFAITSSTTADDYATILSSIGTAITNVTSGAATVGATQTAVKNESSYVTTLSNTLDDAVSSLVDADMNVASTRLQALQTQYQLAIQGLSITNQDSALALKLLQ